MLRSAHNMTLHHALHCIEMSISSDFGDQMQEHNTKECNDGISVHPSIMLHCDECQREGNAMQCMVQRHTVNQSFRLQHHIHTYFFFFSLF